MSNKLMISLQTAPVAIKLLAQSKTVSSNGRGRQPSIICAFAELNARFSPRRGATAARLLSNSAASRKTKSGTLRVGTLLAASPRRARNRAATSASHAKSLAAMNRWPAASGAIIARI